MSKSCEIIFEETGPKVTFEGDWIRRDLDVAYRAMFKELPKHLVRQRKLLEKGGSENAEPRGRKARS